MAVDRFIVVYDADGGLWGELRYLAGKLSGTSECAACDITHGPFREKREWQRSKSELGVPLAQLHRNELSAAMRAAASSSYPCVLSESEAHFALVLSPSALAELAGDPQRLAGVLRAFSESDGQADLAPEVPAK